VQGTYREREKKKGKKQGMKSGMVWHERLYVIDNFEQYNYMVILMTTALYVYFLLRTEHCPVGVDCLTLKRLNVYHRLVQYSGDLKE
jgi:hypothetical protein